ncbi:MAG: imidazole glycerol phosphate synthase subunit HisF [Deltaproteobacteria bacterium]|jgi:cyclase|nr:imidazole glycerol phosphate synthase subunit HisF [Deltaproteobacteria bacterium]
MLAKRIIVCLDVRDGKLTKGVKFRGNVEIGDPVEAAKRYYEDGADEIIFYDITASSEKRSLFLNVVEKVAEVMFIPFGVGGGISSVPEMRETLLAGAEKVSVNSSAVRKPGLIAEGALAFGSQAVVLGLDARKVPVTEEIPSGYEVIVDGGRTPTGLDAVAWAIRAERLGIGEICLNSIDADGTREGYELNLTRLVSDAVSVPVIASGGAGKPSHLRDALTSGGAGAALVASIVHYGEYPIPAIKRFLADSGIPTRLARDRRESPAP